MAESTKMDAMPRSVCVHPDRLDRVRQALERNGYLTQRIFAVEREIAVSTVSNFFTGKNVSVRIFEEICEALGLDPQEMVQPLAVQPLQGDRTSSLPRLTPDWVEREDITESLLSRLQPPRRVLVLSGISGMGKTTLVTRLLQELEDNKIYCSLDLKGSAGDFASSGEALLRKLGAEPTLENQQDAKTLLAHIVDRLCKTPYRVQIDSLEQILKGNETEGWSDFEDNLWLEFFETILTMNQICDSQLLVTTQDVPGKLEGLGCQYEDLWHCEKLEKGLKDNEQLELFRKLGLGSVLDADGEDADYLKRIGRLYEGHPLVLEVIAKDINDIQARGGNVARYWQEYKFGEMEEQRPVRFSRRQLQIAVQIRIQESLKRLPEAALRLLCRGAVYRRPVPEGFWLALLPEVEEAEKLAALDLLKARGLALEVWEPDAWLGADGAVPLRQHNLIRQVAYGLLQREGEAWQQAERGAAAQWLAGYEPKEGVERLETVRGYLEAFDHYCDGEDWEAAEELFMRPLQGSDESQLPALLKNWSYYREQLRISQRLLPRATPQTSVFCQRSIGSAFFFLSQYPQALAAWQKSLEIAREIGDRQAEGNSFRNLGVYYLHTEEYERAIEFFDRALAISRELGDRRGESHVLGNLGTTYKDLGKYRQARSCHEQALVISRAIGDRQGEGNDLGSLGVVCVETEEYKQAILFAEQYLKISREIGDRQAEGAALGILGIACRYLGEYKLAISFTEKWLEIMQKIGNKFEEATALANLGYIYLKLEDYLKAIMFFNQDLQIAQEIDNYRRKRTAFRNLAIAYKKLGDQQIKMNFQNEALESLKTSFAILREIQYPAGEAEVLKSFAELYLKTDRLDEALESCNAALQIATDLGIPLAKECEELKQLIVDSG